MVVVPSVTVILYPLKLGVPNSDPVHEIFTIDPDVADHERGLVTCTLGAVVSSMTEVLAVYT